MNIDIVITIHHENIIITFSLVFDRPNNSIVFWDSYKGSYNYCKPALFIFFKINTALTNSWLDYDFFSNVIYLYWKRLGTSIAMVPSFLILSKRDDLLCFHHINTASTGLYLSVQLVTQKNMATIWIAIGNFPHIYF